MSISAGLILGDGRRPRLLDLFCGAGGAGAGYAAAGFEVVGVDIAPQPRYPFPFVRADAIEYLRNWGDEFDAVHASPPCQRFSVMTSRHGPEQVGTHPDLVEPTRARLRELGVPYVIENVPAAPLIDPITLCGSMFALGVPGTIWQLRRHRVWESNVPIAPPGPCRHTGRAIGVYGHAGGASKRDGIAFAGVAEWRIAMGIGWMTADELAEAIPPAYTRWLGPYLLRALAFDVEPEQVDRLAIAAPVTQTALWESP